MPSEELELNIDQMVDACTVETKAQVSEYLHVDLRAILDKSALGIEAVRQALINYNTPAASASNVVAVVRGVKQTVVPLLILSAILAERERDRT
jgi:hypothetical protein